MLTLAIHSPSPSPAPNYCHSTLLHLLFVSSLPPTPPSRARSHLPHTWPIATFIISRLTLTDYIFPTLYPPVQDDHHCQHHRNSNTRISCTHRSWFWSFWCPKSYLCALRGSSLKWKWTRLRLFRIELQGFRRREGASVWYLLWRTNGNLPCFPRRISSVRSPVARGHCHVYLNPFSVLHV